MSAIKVDVAPTLPLDAKEYNALLKAVPKVITDPTKAAKVRVLIRCMRFTGLAIGDAVTLRREKIKFDEKRKVWRVVTSLLSCSLMICASAINSDALDVRRSREAPWSLRRMAEKNSTEVGPVSI